MRLQSASEMGHVTVGKFMFFNTVSGWLSRGAEQTRIITETPMKSRSKSNHCSPHGGLAAAVKATASKSIHLHG